MSATAHRPTTRRRVAPRAPRRVSGPARPRRVVATPAPVARRAMHAGTVALPRPTGAPAFAPRALDALRTLPDSRWLDRLLRGRAWIAIIGIALGGIVALQVSLLKVNGGIGRAVEHSGTLERQNADLRASVSELSSEERIQREALAQGLVMPAAGDVRYVTARGDEDAFKAARVMRAPDKSRSRVQAAATTAAPATATAAAPAADPAAATTTTAPPEQQAVAPTAPPAEPQAQAAQPVQPAAATSTQPPPPAATTAGAAVAPAGAGQ